MKAHDVRHLCICPRCERMGDDREMISWFPEMFHPDCFAKEFGEDAIFGLERSERRKFRLGDVSTATMHRLLEEI